MNNISITKKELSNMKPLNPYVPGTEADVYINDDKLIKIYFDKDFDKFYNIDLILSRGNINGVVNIEHKVDVDNINSGVSMKYYDGYKTINELLDDDNISFLTRLKHCKEMIIGLKNMHDNELVHADFNINNVLVKEDALIIDVDGGIAKELLSNEDFERAKQNDKYNASITSLSYLYGIGFEEAIYYKGYKTFIQLLKLNKINSELIDYINKLLCNDSDVYDYFDIYIDDLKKDTVIFQENNRGIVAKIK